MGPPHGPSARAPDKAIGTADTNKLSLSAYLRGVDESRGTTPRASQVKPRHAFKSPIIVSFYVHN